MSPAAVSVLAFGLYLAGGGILLVLVPGWLCGTLGLRSPDPFWVRLSGMFFLDLAFYCVRAARAEWTAFFRWSVFTRPVTLPFLAVVVACGRENASILVFGFIDVLAAAWTLVALHHTPRHRG
jgi:hypothetical protein